MPGAVMTLDMYAKEPSEQKPPKPSKKGRVVVYTTPVCPRCAALKEWLKQRGVEYEEKNMEDSEVMAELVMDNVFALSAPVLKVGDRYLLEDDLFEEDKLKADVVEEVLSSD